MEDKKSIMTKKRKYVWISVFVALIFLPQAAFMLFGKYADNVNHEKRELAEKPSLSAESYKEYSSDYEEYYNDHIPFRNELIKVHNYISYKAFNKSESSDVVIGKDGWLFFDSEKEGDPIKDHQRLLSFADIELEKIVANLTALSKYASENDIPFVLFVVPNKENVYSEYLPDYVTLRSSNATRCEQLTAFLNENTDITVINPSETFDAYKQAYPQYNLYYKQDTHWTRLGAYIGTRQLMSALGVNMPDIGEINVASGEAKALDLIEMLNLTSLIPSEPDYILSGYGGSEYQTEEMEFNGLYRMSNKDAADGRKIMIVRDSFALNMAEYVASYFAETVMPHRTAAYTPQMLKDEKPDIIVLEIAERYLYQLMGGFVEEDGTETND